MSNVFKFVKKVFTLGVVSTTVLWSSAFSLLVPSIANAAACPADLKAGDMVKVTGKPAIYVLDNNKKTNYFPSGDVFKSWRATYGGYKSISMACLDELGIPSKAPYGVNYRAGSYVVKRPSSDQLYGVMPGNMIVKMTASVASALYGSGYKVMVVEDQFWPNYTISSNPELTEAKPHAGMLVMNGGKTWYVNGDGKLQEVTDSGLSANGFQSKFVRSVTDAMVAGMAGGDVISAEVAAIADKTQSGGVVVTPSPTPSPTPTPSGTLSVSLASDNPFAATVVSDTADGAQAMIPVLKLVFTAGSDGDVKVTNVKFKRGGVSADTDISNMHLYDGETRLASNPSVANNVVSFTNTSGLFTVSKGSSKTVTVKLDLKNNVSSGKTITFSLVAKEDVAPAASSGSFPLTGNTFTTASVTDLGKLDFSSSSPSAAGTVDPGTTGFEIWRLQAANTDQDIEVRKLIFTIVGSVSVGDLKNFTLWEGGKQVGTTQADMMSDKTVVFDLSSAPFVATKGQTKIFSLKTDIVGGTNRNFRATLQNASDIITYDKNYSVMLKADGTDSFAIIEPNSSGTAVNWTINVGTLTQTLASDSPTTNIPDGATNVVLAKFMWKANGEDIKVSSLNVSSTSSGNSLSNLRLLVNGSQVGTTIGTHTASNGSDNGWSTFGNSFIIKAGQSAEVKVVADTTHTSVAAGETIVVGFPAGSSNAQGVTSLTSISTVAQTGNTLTVRSGQVAVTKNVAFGDKSATTPNGPVNAQQVQVGSFVVTAGSGEDVEVTQFTLKDDTAGICVGTNLQNLTLKDQTGKQIAPTYSNPSTSCTTANSFSFSVSPAVKISNGAQYVVNVFADLKAATTTARSLLEVDAVTATGVTTGQDASCSSSNSCTGMALSLQNQYISSAGALMIQADSDTPVATNELMGAVDKTIAKFKVTASSTEAINITQFVVSGLFGPGATSTIKNVRLVDDTTGQQIGSTVSSFSDVVAGSSSPTTTYSHATFTSLNLQIPKGISKTIALKVDFVTFEDAGFTTTGQTVVPVILPSYTGTSGNNPVTAVGASSGSSLTATISNNNSSWANIPNAYQTNAAYAATTTLYRAKLTTAWASDAPSGASSPSGAQTVAKFVITNLANAGSYTATVNVVNFDLSSTISPAAASSRTLTVYKDSLSTTALGSTTANNSDQNTGFTAAPTGITDGNFTDVDITSGASKTFYVTLNTTDAASTKSFSIRVANNGVTWTDGKSTSLTVMGQDLPLLYKTFTY